MPNESKTQVRGLVKQLKQAVKRDETRLLHIASGIALLVAGAALGAIALIGITKPTEPTGAQSALEDGSTMPFSPPALSTVPAGPAGDAIRARQSHFDDPWTNASAYVGNAMACKNCHLDSAMTAITIPPRSTLRSDDLSVGAA